jgi:putative acetyltransferase
MTLRLYEDADLGAVVDLFTVSVHALGATAYSAAQLDAWAPRPPDLSAWRDRLAERQTVLCEGETGLAGFVAYEASGHVDMLFVAPDAARLGVASRLLEQVAQALPGTALFTEASLVAKPFFLRHGFCVTEAQQVVRRGVAIQRVAMRKPPVREAG